jgi:hypothetical protein
LGQGTRFHRWPQANETGTLLFVDDFSAGDVDIFTVPGLKLKQTVTGFTHPNGMCADSEGNVWLVAVGYYPKIYKLSRNGTVLESTPTRAAIQRVVQSIPQAAISPFRTRRLPERSRLRADL